MKFLSMKASLCAALMAVGLCSQTALAQDAAREATTTGGWAAMAGGTTGGSAATTAQIYTVTNRNELLNAITNGGTQPKIIKVVGLIDMSSGTAFANAADQAVRGAIRLKSNTTLFGDGTNAGFTNGHIILSGVSQIIIRNLKIVNPCDVAPTLVSGEGWKAAYDAILISGSDHIWIDHNSFTDAPKTDDTLIAQSGYLKQCHDGAIDITDASDYVTLSYNNIAMHRRAIQIGANEAATGDLGKLRVTLHNNLFSNLVQGAPHVHFGQVHLYNNYYTGSPTHPVYPLAWSIGVGYKSQIISDYNVFELAPAGPAQCSTAVVAATRLAAGLFKDTGSRLNNSSFPTCSLSSAVTWSTPYVFTPQATAMVKALALANAGGGKLTTTVTGTGNVAASSSSSSTSSSTSSSSSSTSSSTSSAASSSSSSSAPPAGELVDIPPADAAAIQTSYDTAEASFDKQESVAGADTNGDGIRDDIGSMISGWPLNAAQLKWVRAYAKATQATITANLEVVDASTAYTLRQNQFAASSCMGKTLGFNTASDLAALIRDASFNTAARRAQKAMFAELIAGSVFDFEPPICS